MEGQLFLFESLPRALLNWISEKYFHPCELLILRLVNKFFLEKYKTYHKIYYYTNYSIFEYSGRINGGSEFMVWINKTFSVNKYNARQTTAMITYGLSLQKDAVFADDVLIELGRQYDGFDEDSVERLALREFGKNAPLAELTKFLESYLSNDCPYKYLDSFFRGTLSRTNDEFLETELKSSRRWYMAWSVFELGQVASAEIITSRRIDERKQHDLITGAISVMNFAVLEHLHDYIVCYKKLIRMKEKHVNDLNRDYLTNIINFDFKYDLTKMTLEKFIVLSVEEFRSMLSFVDLTDDATDYKIYKRCLKCPSGDKMLAFLKLANAKINSTRAYFNLIFRKDWSNLQTIYDYWKEVKPEYVPWVLEAWYIAQTDQRPSRIEVRFLEMMLTSDDKGKCLLRDANYSLRDYLNRPPFKLSDFRVIIDKFKFILFNHRDELLEELELKTSVLINLRELKNRVLIDKVFSLSMQSYFDFRRDFKIILNELGCNSLHEMHSISVAKLNPSP